jgi:RNA-dependent RNA polymerase
MEQNQPPLDRSPRQKLAMIGEQKALELLTKISKTKIQRSFDGYIVYLINNPSSNYVSPHKPSPPPPSSSLSESSISPSRSQLPSHPPSHCVLTGLGELEFRKSFLLMSYAGE